MKPARRWKKSPPSPRSSRARWIWIGCSPSRPRLRRCPYPLVLQAPSPGPLPQAGAGIWKTQARNPHPLPSPALAGEGELVKISCSVEASRCARGAHLFTLGEGELVGIDSLGREGSEPSVGARPPLLGAGRRSTLTTRSQAAYPGLPSTPLSFGVYGWVIFTVFLARRYCATMSQTGFLSSGCGWILAQPATL